VLPATPLYLTRSNSSSLIRTWLAVNSVTAPVSTADPTREWSRVGLGAYTTPEVTTDGRPWLACQVGCTSPALSGAAVLSSSP
jgi:hypothetical protein